MLATTRQDFALYRLLLPITLLLISISEAYEWNCMKPSECYNQVMTCPENEPCHVYCHAAKACQLSMIDASSSTDLTVYCMGTSSCEDATIECGSGDCDILCSGTGTKQCKSLSLSCGTSECDITCDGVTSCSDSTVHVDKASLFSCTGQCPSNFPTFPPYAFTTTSYTGSHNSSTRPIPDRTYPIDDDGGSHADNIPDSRTNPNVLSIPTSANASIATNTVPSNWIKKDSIRCVDGTTDLHPSNPYKDEYCQICADNTAGINGICKECATLKVPNHSKTDCVFIQPWWLYVLETIIGLFFFLFVGFCTQRCCKHKAPRQGNTNKQNADEGNPAKPVLSSPKALSPIAKAFNALSPKAKHRRRHSEDEEGLLKSRDVVTGIKSHTIEVSAFVFESQEHKANI